MFFSYEQKKSYENAKICYICKRILKKNMVKKKICEVGDLCHFVTIQVNVEVLHITYAIWNIVCIDKLPQFFAINLTMTINLS